MVSVDPLVRSNQDVERGRSKGREGSEGNHRGGSSNFRNPPHIVPSKGLGRPPRAKFLTGIRHTAYHLAYSQHFAIHTHTYIYTCVCALGSFCDHQSRALLSLLHRASRCLFFLNIITFNVFACRCDSLRERRGSFLYKKGQLFERLRFRCPLLLAARLIADSPAEMNRVISSAFLSRTATGASVQRIQANRERIDSRAERAEGPVAIALH